MQFLIDIALSLIYFGAFLILCAWSWRFWKMYVNQQYLNKTNDEYIMLEIKLPREIFKSPFATEMAISALIQGGGVGTWYDRNFKGQLPMYSSLEIASIEGIIHFYVRVQNKFRELVESNFYAQYPGIEIVEADDYTKLIRYHHLSNDVSCWGATYKLKETWVPTNPKTGKPYDDDKEKDKYKMKADFLPLKTYTDYELEQNPKEEFKIDPITMLLEYLGSIGKGEHFWYQIIIQDAGVYDGKKFPEFYINADHEHVSLDKMAKEYKKQIRTGSVKLKGAEIKDQYGNPIEIKDKEGNVTGIKLYGEDISVPIKENELTAEDKWKLDMVNKKFGKPLAMGVVRLMYVAKKENFSPQNIQKILAYPKPYAGANQFGGSFTNPYAYPWQDTNGKRVPWRTEEMFDAYVEREGFYPHVPGRDSLDSWEDKFFWSSSMKTRKVWRMLYEGFLYPFSHPHPEDVSAYNLEEIATLWHLPGAVATTPTLPRIDSARGVAPVNLPQ